MSDNVEDAVPQILQAIQRDIAELRTEMRRDIAELRSTVDARFDRVDEVSRKQRRDTAGLLVMAKAMAGDFAEQLAAVEERVAALEAREAGH